MRMLWKQVAATMMCIMLISCSRVNQSNFDKITPSMSMQDVTAILGEPSTSESITIGGVSGTSAVWKQGRNQIVIQFLNGTVFFKTFSKDGQDKSSS